jgi:tRNA dimethylallyltransferase
MPVNIREVHLCGPTASGKSGVAERLALEFNGEIISVDSAQIYRGMDIGTAKPPSDIRARIAHHLIDILEPEQSYSAAQFSADANAAILDVQARGKLPILVGGTMLYFRALGRGLSELPVSDPDIRASLQADLAARGSAALHADLARVDAKAADRIHANDTQRILRALEVFQATGTPISDLQTKASSDASEAHAPEQLRIAIFPTDRAALHIKIAERFDAMLEAGLVAEVAKLRLRTGLTADHPSMRSVGYRQTWAHLDGEYDLAELREKGIAATRQLAKRQITWLRSDPGLRCFDGNAVDVYSAIAREIFI